MMKDVEYTNLKANHNRTNGMFPYSMMLNIQI